MGGVVDTIFGGGQAQSGPTLGLNKTAKKLNKRYPSIFGTGYSTIDRTLGQTALDPFIRDTLTGGLNRFTENTQDIRNRLLSNENPFTQAMVDPYLRAYERGRGELQRNVARTGVRGTFADRSLQDYDISGQRELGNVRAEAEARTLDALTALDQSQYEADRATAVAVLDQELKSLGLSAEMSNAFLNALVGAYTGARTMEESRAGGLWPAVTGIAAGIGQYNASTANSPTFGQKGLA